MALFLWHISIGKRLHHIASSKSNVHVQTRRFGSAWPWFARINWKNYHSIISICATSLCKGENGAGPKSDKVHLQERGQTDVTGDSAQCITLNLRAEWIILSPIRGFSASLETLKWARPPCVTLASSLKPLTAAHTCVGLLKLVIAGHIGCMQRLKHLFED